ncbi:recombinase family protein [Polynucleobacter paneuropaeus]|nr:recombinase family protein [Polynucleobacter paneuropaeus]
MKKCVLYSRVSTDKQQCLNQIIEMTEYTKKSNLQIVKTYQDDSTSSRKEISQRVIPPYLTEPKSRIS